MKLFTNTDATIAYGKGVVDGTISDTITEIYEIVMDQEIVSYTSEKTTYIFDYMDFADEF